MSNPRGSKPILCPHGVLGKGKCKRCRRQWELNWLNKGNNRKVARRAQRKWASTHGDHKRAYARRRLGIPEEGGKKKHGVCPLCRHRKDLVPDHNHKTGKLRGWICGVCNRTLGLFENNQQLFRRFKRWIKN